MLDIFFLSFRESNAEENWLRLCQRFPKAKRVHGITGVYQAHRLVSQAAATDFYFLVDGDNWIHDDFDFQAPPNLDPRCLYVWRARNPVNDLLYGFGGIKLYNKALLTSLQAPGVDVATTVAPSYKPIQIEASTTRFNASPLESWRGAFRECAKLTQTLHQNTNDSQTHARLQVWLTQGAQKDFGSWCLLGAQQGHEWAQKMINEGRDLSLINDFSQLEEKFHKITTDSPLRL